MLSPIMAACKAGLHYSWCTANVKTSGVKTLLVKSLGDAKGEVQ